MERRRWRHFRYLGLGSKVYGWGLEVHGLSRDKGLTFIGFIGSIWKRTGSGRRRGSQHTVLDDVRKTLNWKLKTKNQRTWISKIKSGRQWMSCSWDERLEGYVKACTEKLMNSSTNEWGNALASWFMNDVRSNACKVERWNKTHNHLALQTK